MSQNEPRTLKLPTANRKKEKKIPAEPEIIFEAQEPEIIFEAQEPEIIFEAKEPEIIFEEVPDSSVAPGEYVEIYQLTHEDGDVYCLTLQEAMKAGSILMMEKRVFTFEPVDIKITSKRYKALYSTDKYVAKVKEKQEKQAGEKKSAPKSKKELPDGTRVRHRYKDDVWYGVFEKGVIHCETETYASFSGFGATHKRVVSGNASRSCNGVAEVEYLNEETKEWVKGLHK
jgi:hypothetical protein